MVMEPILPRWIPRCGQVSGPHTATQVQNDPGSQGQSLLSSFNSPSLWSSQLSAEQKQVSQNKAGRALRSREMERTMPVSLSWARGSGGVCANVTGQALQ